MQQDFPKIHLFYCGHPSLSDACRPLCCSHVEPMKSTKVGPNIGCVLKVNLDLAILQPAHLDPARRAPLIETEQNLFILCRTDKKKKFKRRDITNQAVKMKSSGDLQMRELSNFQGCANNLKMEMEVAARLDL